MRSFNEYKSDGGVTNFFGKLMSIRQQAHILHLSSKSFSEHKALGGFYEGLTDLLDKLIEVYQGQYGIVAIEQQTNKEKTALELLTNSAEVFKSAHDLFSKEDTHIHNILDEVVALTFQTLYKVKNLK